MRLSNPILVTITVLALFVEIGHAAVLNNTRSVFADTTIAGRVKIHHMEQGGFVMQLGKQHVSTYNDFEHASTAHNNNMVGQNQRFLSFRAGHEVMFRNVVSAGVVYGLDIYIQLHDVRAFVPLMMNVSKDVKVARRLNVVVTERAGYSFYLRSPSTDPLLQRSGVTGGFTSETLAGLSVWTKRHRRFEVLTGYRLQHLRSKSIFTPDPSLANTPGLPALPRNITEITTGFYSFVYFSIGVSF